MIPKINFVWSWIYQEGVHTPKNLDETSENYEEYVNSFISEVSKEWDKFGEDILRYMGELTGLTWKKSEINCYVIKISESYPFSDPLTIPIQNKCGDKIFTMDKDTFIDTLIHELIHNLQIQNKVTDKYFDYLIKEKYKDFSFTTAIEIPIHAIHKEIFLRFFDKERLDKHVALMSNYSEYKKSWDIVNKEGSKNIVEELKKFI